MTNCSCLVLFIVVDQRKFWRVLQPIICVWKQSEIGILIFFFRSIEKITFFGSHCEKNGIENNNPFLCSFVNVIWDHFCVTNAHVFKVSFFVQCTKMQLITLQKEYFPNLLESTLLVKMFVFWVRDLKFWLLAYFSVLLRCAKFQQDWTTLILDILKGPHFKFLDD